MAGGWLDGGRSSSSSIRHFSPHRCEGANFGQFADGRIGCESCVTKDGGMTASELVKVLINCGSVVSFLDESGIQVGGSSDEVT